jgi:ABC-type nickel/cobalt efflux system permease component RcnA
VRSLAFVFTPGLATAPPIEVPLASPTSLTSGVAAEAAAEPRAGGLGGLIAPERVTAPLVVLSLLGAAAFGAVHALEPGHGKTLVAAYFVGTRGTAPQAVLLGLIVAATHTVGVFAIGVVTLVGSKYVLPEELYPWLSAASGLVLAAIGITLLRPRLVRLLRRRLGDRGEHSHDHAHAHEHEHGHDHSHTAHGHSHVPRRAEGDGPPWRGLIALGLADGLVPTPSTLVVLLAAVSLDRVLLGLGLIAAFSAGFGAVLTGLALVFVYARRWFGRLRWERGRPGLGGRALVEQGLPALAGLVLVGVGLSLSARSLVDVL